METYFNIKTDLFENINFDINENNNFCEKIKNDISAKDFIFIKNETCNNTINEPMILINQSNDFETINSTTINTTDEPDNNFIINDDTTTSISL